MDYHWQQQNQEIWLEHVSALVKCCQNIYIYIYYIYAVPLSNYNMILHLFQYLGSYSQMKQYARNKEIL